MTTPVLIDADPGVDDFLAILLAIRSPEITVEAVTTVGGMPAQARNQERFTGS
ncbi:MAG: nucleoside hydrolase [Dehalococcoidia bacterium]